MGDQALKYLEQYKKTIKTFREADEEWLRVAKSSAFGTTFEQQCRLDALWTLRKELKNA